MSRAPIYKVVETSTVTAEELEEVLNRWTAEGWNFQGFHFVIRESSRRPAMAFILFQRPAEESGTKSNKEE